MTIHEARQLEAWDYTFGVELETIVPHGVPFRIGGYYSGAELCETLTGVSCGAWKASSDVSIVRGNDQDCEFVSPILKGAEGLEDVGRMCQFAKDHGARVNKSCGVHVHVGLPNCLSKKERAAVVERLANFVGRVEAGIIATTGTRNRYVANQWCAPIKHKVRQTRWGKTSLRMNDISDNRYHGLNLVPVTMMDTDPTDRKARNAVEFRYFSGSLNETKIKAWIKMCVAMVQYAVKSTKRSKPNCAPATRTKYDAPTQAERELNRLFHSIGWIGGFCTHERLGHVDGGLDPREIKILRKMANKFGTQTGRIHDFPEFDTNEDGVPYSERRRQPQEQTATAAA
jgi:hypothetical protein